jgi:hypothetical protein
MTFNEMTVELTKRLKESSSRGIERIKAEINEQILELCRNYDLEYAKKATVITLDGSAYYDLDTECENLVRNYQLIDSNSNILKKLDFEYYTQRSDKGGFYSILGNQLYIEGDSGTVTFMYFSAGGILTTDLFPLVNDDDEVPITIYYYDIILQAVYIKRLIARGDIGTIEEEKRIFADKVKGMLMSENRGRNIGQPNVIGARSKVTF